MYQSRIKQEIRRKNLLLPVVGEAPRPAFPAPLTDLATGSVPLSHMNSTRGYGSAAAALLDSPLSIPTAHITSPLII
jgi:hypothetical protein